MSMIPQSKRTPSNYLESIRERLNGYFENQVARSKTIFRIRGSNNLSSACVRGCILAAGFCPFISENRIGGNLEFIVVPYRLPESFKKIKCESEKTTKEGLYCLMASTRSLFSPSNLAEVIEAHNAYSSNLLRAPMMVEYFKSAYESGTVLDVGCGNGLNSKPLLEKGWTVIAVDLAPEALERYKKKALKINAHCLNDGHLALINADILTVDLSNYRFDLIIAIDVLPFIQPLNLITLMGRIHKALTHDGKFIGTLYFSEEDATTLDRFRRMSQLGAHFYPRASIVPTLLEHTGFKVEDCSIFIQEDRSPFGVQFEAVKQAPGSAV